MAEEVFQYNISSGLEWNNWFKPLMGGPLDARTIVKSRASLDEAEFKSYNPFIGMIVVVVDDQQDSNNNGLWWAYGRGEDGLLWEQIKMGSSSGIDWPPAPSPYDPNKKYFLRFTGEGTEPVWEEVSIEEGQSFTFTVKEPFITSDDEHYTVDQNEVITSQMTLQNQYDQNTKVADVIAVKDAAALYHLMINPEVNFLLFGGDSEGIEKIKLYIDHQQAQYDVEYGVHELNNQSIGIKWLYDNNLVTTDPNFNDIVVHWFSDSQMTQEVFPNTDTTISQSGESLVRYCYAHHDDDQEHGKWYDSNNIVVTFNIHDDSVIVEMTINDITRTTAEIEN